MRPALPVVGTCRLIDIAPSDLVPVHVPDVRVVQQHLPHSLHQHPATGRPGTSTAPTAACGSCPGRGNGPVPWSPARRTVVEHGVLGPGVVVDEDGAAAGTDQLDRSARP